MVNGLEQKLGIIQRQKAVLKKALPKETNRQKRMEIALQLLELTKEEREILRSLGL